MALTLILGLSTAAATPVAAAYVVTITDQSVTKNQDIIFDYENIHPGFSSAETIEITNQSSSWARIEFQEIEKNSEDPNHLFSHAALSLTSPDKMYIYSPPGTDQTNLLNPIICMESGTTIDLTPTFHLPTDIGNEAQQDSLSVNYPIMVTTADACIEDRFGPITPPPTPPNTGTNNLVSGALGTTTATSFSLIILIGIAIILFKLIFRRPKVIKILSTTFLIFCFITLGAVSALTFFSKATNEPVNILGHQPFILASGSMEPQYQTSSFVLTRQDPFSDVVVGDLIAFRSATIDNQTALHRVIEITEKNGEKHLTVMGDNNQRPDSNTVTADNYLGRAVWHTNLPATFIRTLKSPGGWVPTIALPLLSLALIIIGIRFLKNRAPRSRHNAPQNDIIIP